MNVVLNLLVDVNSSVTVCISPNIVYWYFICFCIVLATKVKQFFRFVLNFVQSSWTELLVSKKSSCQREIRCK